MEAGKQRGITQWLEYLDWCIGHWAIIRQEHFHWMNDGAPAVPAMGFLVKFASRFEQAYEAKEALEAMARLSTRDRGVQRLMRAGMEQETAEREVDDRAGLTRERERIESAAASIKRERIARQTDDREREATERRTSRWKNRHEAAQLTAGTFDQWQ